MADKEKDIGALWEKRTQKGAPFFSGTITVNGETVKFVAFKNGYKKEEKHPDFRLFLSKPGGESRPQYGDNDQALAETPNPASRGMGPGYMSGGIEYPKEDIDPNDIPF